MTQIIVLNFGSQVAHLINRRIRELGIFSELVPYNISAEKVKQINPKGIIFSGGPSSVYEKGSPLVDTRMFELGIPILGICYGFQLIAKQFGEVSPHNRKEYGKKQLSIKKNGTLLKGLKKQEQIWMSHGDLPTKLSKDFVILARTDTTPIASAEDNLNRRYGVLFHPEVVHTPKGRQILKNFVFEICKCKKDWSAKDALVKMIAEVKEQVGMRSVIMGTSGGVDSTVAAAVIHEAIGDRLHCVFIDHGLIRKNEADEVRESFKKLHFKNFNMIDASNLFLKRLEGVTDPEQKRKIIGHTFIEVFEKKEKELKRKYPNIAFLGQGTIYPDRIESAQPNNQASKIKSHHNVTLPETMRLLVLEPLKELYKDEVRELGEELGLPKAMIYRHPFPGPGFAIRIVGAVTRDRLAILREADHIFMQELFESGYYDKVWQALCALFPIKAVGVKGDARTYEYIISIRAVTSIDAMTADWAKLPTWLLEKISTRILNEVRGVNRVVYDITQKPPGTIEYE